MLKANERFIDWKSSCHRFYKKNPTVTPKEFLERPDQWEWLVRHFEEPKQKLKCEKMQSARLAPNHLTHHVGKLTLTHRADKIASKGHKAPHVAAYAEAYAHDPVGAEIVEKMNEKVQEALAERGIEDELGEASEPLPLDKELEIINECVPQKRGTRISGVGGVIRRAELPRGGARNSALLNLQVEETRKAREEAAEAKSEVNELKERLRVIEEFMKRMSLPGAGSNSECESLS